MKLLNKEVRIENSSKCNASCVICPREKMTRVKTTMPLDHFKYLVNQCKELGTDTISVFGFGEPLLDQTLIEKISYCTEQGLKTFITTNASLLNIDMTGLLLNAGLSHIRFSAHGTFDDYEKVHVGLKFADAWCNIANFVYINENRFNHACKMDVSVIPMHGETIESIIKFWGKIVDDITVWSPHGWAGGRSYRELKRRLKSCGRPSSGPIQIQADGLIIPCCFLTNGEIILGDTNKNTIEEILKGEKYNELRERHKVGNLQGLPCEDCDQRYISEKSPLLYSSDKDFKINQTSSIKFDLEVA